MKRVFVLAFLGVSAFAGGSLVVTLSPQLVTPAVAQTGGRTDLLVLGERFEIVARQVSPAVVAVEATKPATSGTGKSRTVEESGSGVVIRVDGRPELMVLTNNHVIAQAPPEQITINLSDGRLLHPVRVWADPESDVAVLQLDRREDRLPVARLGDSERVRVGQWVLAIGSPFGLNQTVTHGIISARERGQISLGSTIRIKDFLQTDAAINPGSSGGPLVNLDGEVIGINTAIASNNGNNSGVAFSIPVNLVKRVTRQLLDKGSVSRGYLGLQLASSFEPADALKYGLDRAQGALVEIVYPDTPASAAGLKVKDVILDINGTPIKNENQLINMVSAMPAGQKVRMQVWRDRRPLTLDAVVGDWSQGRGRLRTSASPQTP
jgi:S1-C subfamily serine protease